VDEEQSLTKKKKFDVFSREERKGIGRYSDGQRGIRK
jgi:hypothetical protein